MANLIVSEALGWPNLPASVVRALVEQAHLLVARESSESKRRDWLAGQVQWLINDELVGLNAHLLSIANHLVACGYSFGLGTTCDIVD